MAKSIQQIQQNLEKLESSVEKTGRELQDAYAQYLELLSQSAKQQLILASYQLCTQIYPESFLRLSLSQKQKLQQKLRTLGKELKPLIIDCGAAEELQLAQRELNLLAEMIKNLPITSIGKEELIELNREKFPQQTDQSASEDEEDSLEKRETRGAEETSSGSQPIYNPASPEETSRQELEEVELNESYGSVVGDGHGGAVSDSDTSEAANTIFSSSEGDLGNFQPLQQKLDFKNPEHLLLWHQQVESKIKNTLDNLSKKANKCLQEATIIPTRLPSKVLEVALQAEEVNSNLGDRRNKNLPNILSLVIETDKEQKSKSSKIEQIDLLRLRLSEIEFTDTMLNVRRNQIRAVVDKISKLQRQYQDLKRDYTVAEAEAAWRSSWYEE